MLTKGFSEIIFKKILPNLTRTHDPGKWETGRFSNNNDLVIFSRQGHLLLRTFVQRPVTDFAGHITE
jgi:hypothetical protein